MNTRVLVTGGSGFIGSRVVRALVGRGYQVRCLLRPTSSTRRIDGIEWERTTGDIRNPDSVLEAAAGCDALIHLASVSSWDEIRSPAMESVVIEGTRNVLAAATQAGVARAVHISSGTAVNSSTTPRLFTEDSPFELEGSSLRYAIAKHRAEQMALAMAAEHGLELVVAIPVETYGPEDDRLVTAGNLRDVLLSWPAFACYGGTSIAHVDDVAQGIVLALERGRPGQRYILGGDNLTIEQIVRLTLELGGQSGKLLVVLPNRLVKALVATLVRLKLPAPVLPELLDYETLYWFMDSSRACNELGFTARPAREVLQPTVDWLYASGYVK